jgi:hypothetical protein
MSISFNFDSEIIKKRIKSTHLGSRVALASILFAAGILSWLVFEFVFMNHTLVEHNFADLVARPFSFSLNQTVFDAVNSKRQYTQASPSASATDSAALLGELDAFPIYIIDLEASKLARSVVVVDKNTNAVLHVNGGQELVTIDTPDFLTNATSDLTNSDVVELTELEGDDGSVVTTSVSSN